VTESVEQIHTTRGVCVCVCAVGCKQERQEEGGDLSVDDGIVEM